MAYEQVQKPSSSFVPVQKKVSEFSPSAHKVQAKDDTASEQEQMPLGSTPATDANWLMKHPLFKGNQFLQRVVAPASESESLESEEETLQRQEEGNEAATPYSITVQAKLTIGEPGDKYEQEADRVASQVVKQINSPEAAQSTQGQSVQRQEEPVEELQAKPSISDLQRSPLPLEVQREAMPAEEELQAKSILQRREAIAGGEATNDLDTAINSARGGGQPLEAGLQRSMGQAMGADFSGVKVHTDAKSDQLNQSIQAKAFTTGQDVFFRQGAYDPGSRGGQELIAHELTHVVQQNGGAVMRLPLLPQPCNDSQKQIGDNSIQRLIVPHEKEARFVKRFGEVNKGVKEALVKLHAAAESSPHKYSGEELVDALRKKGQLTNKNINGLVDDLNKLKSTDMDEGLSGDRGHSMTRHLTISDKDMEERLRGNNAIAVATRFSTEENAGRIVMKYYRLLSSKVPPLVKQLVTKTCLEALDIIKSNQYTTLPNNAEKRRHLRDALGVQTTIEENEFDIQFIWGYVIEGTGVRIRCEYEIRSVEEFVKEQWRVDAESKEVRKNTLDQIATMYSGSNTPVIQVLNTDNESQLLGKIAESPINNIGVTLF